MTDFRNLPKGETERAEVSFRSDGVRFVYIQRSLDKPKDVFSQAPASFQLVYDGRVTVLTVNGKTAHVEEGLNTRNLRFLPFPGMSLPGMPIIRARTREAKERVLKKVPEGFQLCLAPVLNAAKRARFSYMNGIVKMEEANGSQRVSEIMSGLPGFAMDQWKFGGFRKVNGKWVAFHSSWQLNDADQKNGRIAGVLERREYAFSNVSFDAVDPAKFDVGQYLDDGASVGYRNTKGKVGKFLYMKGHPWAEMAAANNQDGLVTLSTPSSSNNKLVLGLITFVCGIVVIHQFGAVMARRPK